MLDAEQRDRCARVRAARGYANLKQAQLAKKSGISYDTIRRIEQDGRPPVIDELRAIGDACGVPRSFMENGWPARDDVEQLRATLRQTTERLTRLEDELVAEGLVRDLEDDAEQDERQRDDHGEGGRGRAP